MFVAAAAASSDRAPIMNVRVPARLLLALGLCLAAACGSADGAGRGKGGGKRGGEGGWKDGKAEEAALSIAVSAPAIRTIERRYEASGTLRARQVAEIRPVQTAVINALLAEEGDEVEAGQRLARLDGREQALMASRDRVAAENARRELDRLEQIGNADAIAEQEIDLKRFELQAAKAAAKLSRHQASLAEVRAPFDGTITARNVDVGNLATTATIIFEMADMSALELDLHLPEREAAAVGKGTEVELALVDGTEFTGTIERRAPVVDPLTGTVKFTVKITERPERAVPGAFCRAKVLLEARVDVPTVASTAVFKIDGEDHVFVVEDGKATRRKVGVGLSSDTRVEIVDGLDAGDLVVDDPGDGLTDGMTIEAVRSDEPAPPTAAAPQQKTREEG